MTKTKMSGRSLAMVVGGLSAALPSALVMSAPPAAADGCAPQGGVEIDTKHVYNSAGVDIGRVGLYFNESTGCWYGAVAAVGERVVTALLYSGGTDRAHCQASPEAGHKCVTGGSTGYGGTYTYGQIVDAGIPYGKSTSAF